jgi:5-methylcytosine-specific restriction endonuclease McrA
VKSLLTIVSGKVPILCHGEFVHKYLCKCECGNYKWVRPSHLTSGFVKSCGCLHRNCGPYSDNSACPTCGVQFTASIHRKFCSPLCQRRRHRGNNFRKRVMRHGGKYTNVDRIVVFERDKWKCTICGIELASPELDHIIPLSLGGDHVYENCRCVCRDCNLKRNTELEFRLAHTVKDVRKLLCDRGKLHCDQQPVDAVGKNFLPLAPRHPLAEPQAIGVGPIPGIPKTAIFHM